MTIAARQEPPTHGGAITEKKRRRNLARPGGASLRRRSLLWSRALTILGKNDGFSPTPRFPATPRREHDRRPQRLTCKYLNRRQTWIIREDASHCLSRKTISPRKVALGVTRSPRFSPRRRGETSRAARQHRSRPLPSAGVHALTTPFRRYRGGTTGSCRRSATGIQPR